MSAEIQRYPYELTEYGRRDVKARAEQRSNIFGSERLAAERQYRATPEDAEGFSILIQSICKLSQPEADKQGRRQLWLPRPNQEAIQLVSYELPTDPRQDNLHRSQIQAHDVVIQRRFLKPRGMPLGVYAVADSFYLADNGHLGWERSFSSLVTLGRDTEQAASTEDVSHARAQAAIAHIATVAIQHEDNLRAPLRWA